MYQLEYRTREQIGTQIYGSEEIGHYENEQDALNDLVAVKDEYLDHWFDGKCEEHQAGEVSKNVTDRLVEYTLTDTEYSAVGHLEVVQLFDEE